MRYMKTNISKCFPADGEEVIRLAGKLFLFFPQTVVDLFSNA